MFKKFKKTKKNSNIKFRLENSEVEDHDLAQQEHSYEPPWHSTYEIPKYLGNARCPFGKISNLGAGQHKWVYGDNLDNFELTKKKAPSDWKYLTKEVIYTLNNDGYRAPEWNEVDWKNSIVLFGCSCTYGLGVSDDETIAYHLEKLSGRPVINLGVPAGSNSLMIQNAINLQEFFTAPYAVAHIWSTTDRFKFFGKKDVYNAGPWDTWDRDNPSFVSQSVNVHQLWKLTFADPYHELGLSYYEGKIGKWLWKGRTRYSDVSFFSDTAYYTNSEKHFAIDNGARDLIHPGDESFKEVAKYLYERFK